MSSEVAQPGEYGKYIPAAYVVLVDSSSQKMLLTQNHEGKWGFPGGVAHSGESFVEAVKRETRQEIGVEVAGLLPVEQKPRLMTVNGSKRAAMLYVTQTFLGPAREIDQREIKKTAWVTYEEAEQLEHIDPMVLLGSELALKALQPQALAA